MKHTKRLYLLLIAIAISFNVSAEEVYKTTDESGAVVFSDKKSSGAEKIEVKPNVVDVNIPEMPESAAREKSKPALVQPKEEQQRTGGGGSAAGENLRRKIRNTTNAGEKIKQRDKQPVPLPVVRPGGR